MKRFFLFAACISVSLGMMAIGNNSGSTKANAIDFDWENGVRHEGSTNAKWYRVALDPLYEEENPALNLYLTNPDRSNSVDVQLHATVAGQVEERSYTIAPHQNKSWSANASTLVRMKQTEVYLTLQAEGDILLSAKVFEASDLDETCKDAKAFNWSGVTQSAGYVTWWRVDLSAAKAAEDKDVRIVITNKGTSLLNLYAGQSLDCPSSGTTRRNIQIAANDTYIDTVPRSMITAVASDELYVSLENDQPIEIKAELVDQPQVPVIPQGTAQDLHVTDQITVTAGTVHLYRISVAEMNAENKYEPEFTFRNAGSTVAHMTRKMAFELPAYSAQGDNLSLSPGEESIEVIKKNTLEGLEEVEYVYVQIETDQDIQLSGRFKHVREGKACKTNIDFNWETGHRQDGKTTQWYAIDVTEAKQDIRDIIVHIENQTIYNATIKASLAFSCPYIDVQEISRTIGAQAQENRTISYSTYAMMSDTVWVGLETDRAIRIWADTVAAVTQEPDEACLNAIDFNWEEGARQTAGDTVWYKLAMADVRDLQQFPTVYIHNLGESTVTIEAELSLDCPDVIANEKRTTTIEARGTYSKEISRNLFENISQDFVYVRVIATEDISFEVRLTEEAEGSSCASAIHFNWELGNDQEANANLWYAVDLRKAMRGNQDIEIKLVNKDNATCTGSAWLAYTCPYTTPQEANFTLNAKETKTKVLPHSVLETLSDSVLYFRLIGNTALHFEARLIDPEPMEPILCDALTFTKLDWNTLYTQELDTAWYILETEQLSVLDTVTTTPELYIHDLSGTSNTVIAEVAYHCPITAAMMSKTVTLSGNQELTKLIERGTAEQAAKKDAILIRIIATGKIEFKAELVNPNTGNDRLHALDLLMNQDYSQEANTTMWYKVNTAQWKADQTLHGKSLNIHTANHGGVADVRMEIFEDVSNDDLLEGRGHRSIEAGRSASRNVPAYAVYGLADKEVYIKITTNQPLTFGTSTSDYAAADYDPDQASAKLAVPNVDYEVQAGKSWFVICVPYIRNNYILSDSTNVIFSNPNDEEVQVTLSGTWQEQLVYDVPQRTVTVAANDSATKTFKELIDRGISRAGFSYSIAETNSSFLDSLLREFLTSDSLTAFVRVETEKPMKIRVNSPQITGDECINPMAFDWEHGNVNPAGATTWFKVKLDSLLIPDSCDLRLHVENWSHAQTEATATLYFDCLEDEVRTINYKIGGDEDKWKDIDRDLLESLGWADMLIYYHSDSTTRIWVELVPPKDRDSVIVRDTLFFCDGVVYRDIYTGEDHTIDISDETTLHWRDSIEFINDTAVAMWDSIIYVTIVPLQDPQVYPIDSLRDLIVISRGQAIDVSAADAWLRQQLDDDRQANDTLKQVVEIIWEMSLTGKEEDFGPIPTDATMTEAVVLRYSIVTECDEDSLESAWYYNTARDTLRVTECNFYTWKAPEGNDSTYKNNAFDSIMPPIPLLNGCDSIPYLELTILHPLVDTLPAVTKYGNRLLMVHKNQIDSLMSIDLQEEHVTWYQVVAGAEDPEVGNGFYITNDGEPLIGEYYAIIRIPIDSVDSCGLLGYTNILVCEAPDTGPELMPSYARPEEQIRIIHLDPNAETLIRVYTAEGIMLADHTVTGVSTYMMQAAKECGYYLVEVRTSQQKTTLRYIVK